MKRLPKLLKTLFGLCTLCALSTSLAAHPHVWVQVKTEIVYGENETVTGLRHSWTFDEMYSIFALQGLDQNGNGIYDQPELQPLLDVNINSLKEFDYFTFSKSGEQDLTHTNPTDATISLLDNLVNLSFVLPLEQPVKADAAAYSFAVYDPTYYISFTFENDMQMQIASSKPSGCQTQFTAPKQTISSLFNMSEADFLNLGVNVNFGGQFAQHVILQCAIE